MHQIVRAYDVFGMRMLLNDLFMSTNRGDFVINTILSGFGLFDGFAGGHYIDEVAYAIPSLTPSCILTVTLPTRKGYASESQACVYVECWGLMTM